MTRLRALLIEILGAGGSATTGLAFGEFIPVVIHPALEEALAERGGREAVAVARELAARIELSQAW